MRFEKLLGEFYSLGIANNPVESPLFLRISFRHAQYFAKYGDFHRSLLA